MDCEMIVCRLKDLKMLLRSSIDRNMLLISSTYRNILLRSSADRNSLLPSSMDIRTHFFISKDPLSAVLVVQPLIFSSAAIFLVQYPIWEFCGLSCVTWEHKIFSDQCVLCNIYFSCFCLYLAGVGRTTFYYNKH